VVFLLGYMSKIKRSTAILLVVEAKVKEIHDLMNGGDFNKIKDIFEFGFDGVVMMSDKDLSNFIKNSTGIDYEVVSEGDDWYYTSKA